MIASTADPLEVLAAIQQARERAEVAEAQTRELLLAAAVAEHAPSYRIWDAQGAVKLIDRTRLVVDAAGNPRNVLQLLEELVQVLPGLVSDPPKPKPPAPPPVRPMSAERLRRATKAAHLQRMRG